MSEQSEERFRGLMVRNKGDAHDHALLASAMHLRGIEQALAAHGIPEERITRLEDELIGTASIYWEHGLNKAKFRQKPFRDLIGIMKDRGIKIGNRTATYRRIRQGFRNIHGSGIEQSHSK